MRQIQMLVALVAQLLFHKSTVSYELSEKGQLHQTDLLHQKLLELLEQGHLQKADSLLLEQLDSENQKHLLVAIDFYQRLNEKTDDELESGGLSREDINQSLHVVLDRFNIYLPGY